MAIIKSQTFTQASGSVGGTTFSHSKGGLYMRARAIPVNPNTTFQAQVRAGLTNAVNRWTEILSGPQRAAWATYAANTPTTNALGDPIFLSGQNMYIRSQTVAQQAAAKAALGPADTALAGPAIFNLGDFTTPTTVVASIAGGVSMALDSGDPWANEDDARMLVFEGLPMNASRNFFRGPWRLIGGVVGDNAVPPTAIAISAATIAARGYVFAAGQLVNLVVAVLRSDGRLSTRRNLGNIAVTA